MYYAVQVSCTCAGGAVELFRIGFLQFRLIDLLDVLVVSYVFYRMLLLMKGTRSAQIVAGLLLVGVIVLARMIDGDLR